ncbi:MAG: hypothetical protein H6684_06790 [Deltaproteobacteria bacterium]|nr:hypothetical protein [Deltaproteobacteria bacterium]MCB9488419.1 hypothetical protein [Deltaproteobacteria bacterium]
MHQNRHWGWVTALAAALAMVMATGCTIKNKDGEEVFRLKVGDRNDGEDSSSKDDADSAPDASLPSDSAIDDNPAPASDAPAVATETPAEPWWKSDDVKERDLSDSGEGYVISDDLADARSAVSDARDANDGIDSTDLADSSDAGSDSGFYDPSTDSAPADTKVAMAAPPTVKVRSVDRTLAPVNADLWGRTVKTQSGTSATPARRASMDNVQKAIQAGYGTAYVVRLEKAISVDRSNGYAYYFLARGRFEQGDWKGARGFADKSVQLLAGDPQFRSTARVLLAKSLNNSGQIAEAAREAQKAAEEDPNNTEARVLALRLSE